MKHTLVTLAVILSVVAVLGALAWWLWLKNPNRVVIQNSSGVEVHNARLIMQDMNGEIILDWKIDVLTPDTMVTYHHDQNDSRAELTFSLAGQEHRYQEPYIDLWRGEGWLFTILPDGTVRNGYDYSLSGH